MDTANGLATRPPKLTLGQCIVEAQRLKRKYSEIQKAREAIRSTLDRVKPGRYENFQVVSVREVEVKSHIRRAHTRLLLAQ